MNRVRGSWAIAAAVSLCIVAPAWAIELGDAAPPLKIADWVKGKSVDLKDGKDKNIYVVEFWATWCGPCRKSIPHLTEIQKKYKDKGVVVIGVSNEDTKKVKEFVDGMGDKMDYVVAVDQPAPAPTVEGEKTEERPAGTLTNKAYMEAFAIDGIPHAFIVDKAGRLVWSGHPMDGLEQALDQIIDGKYDLEAAKAREKKARESQKMQQRVQEVAMAYFMHVSKDGDRAKGRELAAEITKVCEKLDDEMRANVLNAVAWQILTAPNLKDRDLETALKMAEAANEASKGEEPAVLDTLARALFDTGKKAEAIKHQKKAVELAEKNKLPDEMVDEMKAALKKYESGE